MEYNDDILIPIDILHEHIQRSPIRYKDIRSCISNYCNLITNAMVITAYMFIATLVLLMIRFKRIRHYDIETGLCMKNKIQ